MAQLDEGSMDAIYNGSTTAQPRVQLLDVKRITSSQGADRWRLVISDGRHLMQAGCGGPRPPRARCAQ